MKQNDTKKTNLILPSLPEVIRAKLSRLNAHNSCKRAHPAIQLTIYLVKPNEIAAFVDHKWLNNGKIASGFQPSRPG